MMMAPPVLQPFEPEMNDISLPVPDYCGIRSLSGYIEPYPSVSGIAIIVSFISICSFILILSFIRLFGCYWMDFGIRDLLGGEPLTFFGGKTCPDLQDARRYVEDLRWQEKLRSQRSALSETIYSLGDAQLATGIALLVATFSKRDITMYHCLISDEMAWLAFLGGEVGHAGLLFGRPKFFKNLVRIILLSVLLCLITYMETIINIDADLAGKVYDFKLLEVPDLVSVFMLIWAWISVAVMTVELYPPAWVLVDYYVELHMTQIIPPSPLPGLWPSKLDFQSPSWIFFILWDNLGVFGRLSYVTVVLLWIPAWIINVVVFWLFFNPIMSALASLGFFIWGLYEIINLRVIGKSCMKPEEVGSQDQFDFGQVVSLTILILCVISTGDLWIESMKSSYKKRRANRALTLEPDARPQAQDPRSSRETEESRISSATF